jgi:hypothetical protein
MRKWVDCSEVFLVSCAWRWVVRYCSWMLRGSLSSDSFPLLKNLTGAARRKTIDDGGILTAAKPSNPPTFTGTLEGGIEPFARRLLSLPGGIHFRKLALTWLHGGELLTIIALVEACVGTLESLDTTWDILSTCILHLRPQPITHLCFQVIRGQFQWTSRKRRN